MRTVARRAAGILPDAVIRDRNANAYLFAIVLQANLAAPDAQAWLEQLTALLNDLQAPAPDGDRLATAAVAFGASFFTASGQPRFGLSPAQIPAQLAAGPPPSRSSKADSRSPRSS